LRFRVSIYALLYDKMGRNTSLKFDLVGSATAGEKGYWRWTIFSGSSKKPLQVGSFYGPLPEVKKHAEAAVLRLKERSQKQQMDHRRLPKTPRPR
jgi:hypothetical protein